MDGWETQTRLHEISSCPVIVVTAFGYVGKIVRTLELDAAPYIVKPFGIKELVARVRVLLRRSAPV